MKKESSSGMGKSTVQKHIWSLFFRLFVIFLYVLIGTGLFYFILNPSNHSYTEVLHKTLDSERRELLNVLWAESLAQSEHGWSVIANQKLDNYEKTLRTAISSMYGINVDDKKSMKDKANGALTLIMTLNDFGDPYDMPLAYIGLMLYIFCGIILFYIYLEKFAEFIIDMSFSLSKISSLFLLFTFLHTIVHEMCIEEDEEKPFLKNFLNSFYTVTTITKNQRNDSFLILTFFHIGATSLFFSMLLSATKMLGSTLQRYEENLEFFEESFNFIYTIPIRLVDSTRKFIIFFLGDEEEQERLLKDIENKKNDENNINKNHNSMINNILLSGANSTFSSSRRGSLRLSQKPYDSLHEEEEE
uniref:Ion_trans domain-containing protein n=1 Tax=Parastrongyloides trichosuri TaxID=131310 RepID=A0A0N4Z7V9_PARTI